MSRHRIARAGLLAAVLVLASGPDLAAAPPLASITGAADATAPAVTVPRTLDMVTVFQTGPLTAAVQNAALAAAADVNAPAVVGRGFTAILTRLRRGSTVIQAQEQVGWGFPMAVTALRTSAIGAVMGRVNSAIVAQGLVVMGQTSAGLRGAQVGDTLDLVSPSGVARTFTIGRIAPDAEVGGTEIVMSTDQADLLGATIPTRVLIYGPADRAALQTALLFRGVYGNSKARVRTTWDAPDPDETLGMAQTKAVMGEFDFNYAAITNSGWVAMSAAWKAQYLPTRDTYPTGIKAMCNVTMKADLRAALTDVVNAGLAGYIDVANVNSYGGCGTGSVRYARITQSLGSISRHSWGQPIDMNTTTNVQGGTPHMDCRIVYIFRRHNFAWGGNFLTSDGMHFEWVGTRRDTLQYPSKYCPNPPVGQTQSTVHATAGGATFFADDGWTGE